MTVGLEGKLVKHADLAAIAQSRKKEVLIAMLLSAMQGPDTRSVYALSGVLSKFLCESLQPFRIKKKGEGDVSSRNQVVTGRIDQGNRGHERKLELAELVKGLETRFGVTAAAPVADGGSGRRRRGSGSGGKRRRHLDVILASARVDKKIQVIKVVREPTSPRTQGQGLGRGRTEARQDRRQGRSRLDEEEARGERSQSRGQVGNCWSCSVMVGFWTWRDRRSSAYEFEG